MSSSTSPSCWPSSGSATRRSKSRNGNAISNCYGRCRGNESWTWALAVNSARLPVPKEAAIDLYRRRLALRLGERFPEPWWGPQLELALLGGFLQLAWPKALGAARSESEAVRARERAELVWWSAQVRASARWL